MEWGAEREGREKYRGKSWTGMEGRVSHFEGRVSRVSERRIRGLQDDISWVPGSTGGPSTDIRRCTLGEAMPRV